VERGSHEELMAKGPSGLYRSWWELQVGGLCVVCVCVSVRVCVCLCVYVCV